MKNSTTIVLTLLFLLLGGTVIAQHGSAENDEKDYPRSKVSFSDFEDLMANVKVIRADRLISFEQLKAFQAEPNTVLLDARSRERYNERHLAGAVNLPYTEFTKDNLRNLIPNPNTRILIYCNNNFEGDEVSFASKGISFAVKNVKRIDTRTIIAPGKSKRARKKLQRKAKRKNKKNAKNQRGETKEIMLALNVPTYVTLYGYGYRNIFELGELLDVNDKRLEFKGSRIVRRGSAAPSLSTLR